MADRREYEMLFRLSAQLGANFNGSFNAGQKKLVEMEKELQALNRKQSDITGYQKQQRALGDTNNKLELLKKQYDNIQKEIVQTEGYSADLQNKLLQKQLQIEKTTSALHAHEAKLRQMDEALKTAGVDTQKLTEESAKLSGEYNDLKKKQEAVAQEFMDGKDGANIFNEKTVGAIDAIQNALAAAGLAKLFQETSEAIKACAEASIDFESGMAGIAKTSNLSVDELAAMGESVKKLSTEIPATTNELTQIGETAGQLGIADENLLDFTYIMAELGTATTMTANDAATLLAQFANITRMDPKYYSNLGSAIVDLGNNFATTEQKITEMSQGIAAAGSLAGMSEADMVGLSAAVTSLGIETEMGSTAVTKFISDIMRAVGTGENLEQFARVANMSAEQFKEAWGKDAAGTLTAFITGLSDTTRLGNDAIVTLSNLGITETRMQRTLLSLSNSGDLLTNAISMANNAWEANTALTTEAEKRYATTASKLTMLKNAFNNLKIAAGDQYTPVAKELAETGTELLNDLTEFTEQHPVVVAALTSLTVGALGFGTALTGLSAAATLFKSTLTALKAALAANPWVWAVAGATAAVAALVTFAATTESATEEYENLSYASREQYDELQLLKTQYDEVSEAQGETSVDAQELKYNIDALTVSFEENKRTAEEVAEAQKAVVDAHEELMSSSENIIGGIDNEGISSLNLASKLETLISSEGKTAAAKKEILTLVQMLNEAMPELGLNYDEYSDTLNMTAGQLRAVIQAEIVREKQAANYEELKGLIEQEPAAYAEWQEAIDSTAAAEKELQELTDNKPKGGSRSGMAAYNIELRKAKQNVEECKKAEETLGATYSDNKARQDELTESITGVVDGTDNATSSTERLNLAVADVTAEVSALITAYDEAYTKAYDSISGQMGLFEPMKVEVQTSVDEMIAALESQVSYMASYSENIKKAQEMGLSEGLLAQISDGSADSAAYLQAIVEAGQSKIDELNASYANVEKGKQEYADTIAEMQEGTSEKLAALEQDFSNTVEGLDLSADAKQSAIDTIDGFIQGLDLQVPDALTKMQKFGDDIAAALGASYTITVTGSGNGVEHNARGTANAADVFVAGEEGPELVVGKGGSTVYTAAETEAMAAAVNEFLQVVALSPQLMSYLSGAQPSESVEVASVGTSSGTGTPIVVQVTYQIADGANMTEDMRAQLSTHTEELRQMLLDMLEDIEYNKERGRFK